MNVQPAAISVAETAKRLNISERQVQRMIADRRIASIKLGNQRLIRPEAIEEILRKQEIVAR